MSVQWFVNGVAGGNVDPGDRGLAYGDGLFETMAVRGGQVPRLAYHFERLAEGCERLGMAAPDFDIVGAEIRTRVADRERAVAKLVVTRGTGARGYRPPVRAELTRILGIFPWPDRDASHYTRGIVLASSSVPIGDNPRLAGLKTLARLEQVLAQIELADTADEALQMRTSGQVVGGTTSNVFVVRDGHVSTPALETCGVGGIMRRIVIETCVREGIAVDERDLVDADMHVADEVFVTNALAGVRPVREYDGRAYAVGPVTHRLQQAIHDA